MFVFKLFLLLINKHVLILMSRDVVFGCSDHVVSYSMPEGHTRGDIRFIDWTYDGDKEQGHLRGTTSDFGDVVFLVESANLNKNF